MTGREWQPGDVAMVHDSIDDDDVRAGRQVRILAKTVKVREPVWWGSDGYLTQDSESIEEIRPLVVIDPEDREQVERLVNLVDDCFNDVRVDGTGPTVVDLTQVRLREFASPTPPKCGAALIVKGEHFACDSDEGHALPHGNREAEAVWGEPSC